jgi:hypothetical protein
VTDARRQQISRLYHAALEGDARERAAFLGEACAGDDSLQREVESLLANERRAAGFRSEPALEWRRRWSRKITAPRS